MRLYAASDMALEQEGELPEDTIITTATTAGTVTPTSAADSIVHGEGVGTSV